MENITHDGRKLDLKVDNFGSLGLKWQGAAVHVHFYNNISIETLDGGMLFFSRWCQIQGLVYSSSNIRYESCSLGDSCNSLFDAKLVQRLNFKEQFCP